METIINSNSWSTKWCCIANAIPIMFERKKRWSKARRICKELEKNWWKAKRKEWKKKWKGVTIEKDWEMQNTKYPECYKRIWFGLNGCIVSSSESINKMQSI